MYRDRHRGERFTFFGFILRPRLDVGIVQDYRVGKRWENVRKKPHYSQVTALAG